MEQKIIDHPGWLKINQSFIVNDNEAEYQKARERRRQKSRLDDLEQKVDRIGQQLEMILKFIQKDQQ